MRKGIKIIFIWTCFLSIFESYAQYSVRNAPIGGGGFVTGIITHKTSGDRYCRTDVGGAYRWDAVNNEWVQLLDWFNESEAGFYGVEALALDPQNPNNVYMLCGTSYIGGGRTAILKSTDKGNTFTYTDVSSKFKANGNGNGRGNGERLAVDPQNSNILFCGTRANGLWKSTDAGVTWNLAWNGVTTTSNGNGICFVLFDPLGSVVGGASQTIYIGVSRTGSANIYKSVDGGATFTDISATTTYMPHRAALQGTTMYVTYADSEGPATNGYGNVYKLNTSTGAWTDVTPGSNATPAQSRNYPYGGVSIDPTNVNRVIVSTCGMYWNNQFGTGWGDFIFLSTDGGSTWTLKNGNNATYDANGMGWSCCGAVNWMDCIEFDQNNLSQVRVIGGGGVYTCPDITAANPTWKYDVIGIEETAFLDGVSVPGGPLISSFGDVTGFVHDPLTSYPSKKLSPTDPNNQSIAYAGANTSKLVRASNGGSVVYYSSDTGFTWTGCATNKGTDGRVSISADGATILHCPGSSSTTYYTTDNGANWYSCSGVSLGSAIPVADQVNANYFYIYNPTNGQMLRSSDKGISFSAAGTPGGTSANYPWEATLVRTVYGYEGHLWVPLGTNGLKYSTDHGATYTTVSNVPYCKTVAIGKAMSGSGYPTIFIWGTVSGVTGLFRSTDKGTTWLRMNDDAHQFGGASFLIGDMNVFGRIFMAAGGARGVLWWEPSTNTNTPPSVSLTAPANNSAFCQRTAISLTAAASDTDGSVTKVEFYDGTTLLGTDTSSPYTYTWTTAGTGTHTITAKATDNGGASTTSASASVTVNANPSITPWVQINGGNWQQQNTAILCAGDSLKLGPQPSGTSGWTWTGPNGYTSSIREITLSSISVSQGGIYTTTYTSSGCSASSVFNITVNALPDAVISPSGPITFVNGDSVILNANTGSGLSYTWFNGSTQVGTGASYFASASGSYTVEESDTSGCKATSAAVTVTSSPVTGLQGTSEIQGKVYPNPANSELMVETTMDLTGAKVSAINALGNEVQLPATVNGRGISINVSSLAEGSYLLIIRREAAFLKKKITVVK